MDGLLGFVKLIVSHYEKNPENSLRLAQVSHIAKDEKLTINN